MGREEAPTFSAIAGCDIQNFVLPKKWRSRSGARMAERRAASNLPMSQPKVTGGLFRPELQVARVAHRNLRRPLELRHDELGEQGVGPAEVAARELLGVVRIEGLM